MLVALFGLMTFLLSALIYGRIEKFTFGNCQLHIGPPDFLKYFVRDYHGPMFLMVLTYAVGLDAYIFFLSGHFFGMVLFIPCWAFAEDVFYWIANPFDSITDKSWITASLGGFHLGKQFIPNAYLILATYTAIVSYWRFSHS